MTTTVTLTAYPEGNPAPYVDVLITAIDAGIDRVTVWRTVAGRSFKVRSLVNVSAGGAVTARDFEAPFVEASYRVEQFNASGDFVSFSAAATVTLDPPAENEAWFHDPLDPSTAVKVTMLDGAAGEIVRPASIERLRVQGRSASVAISSGRRGAEGINLDCTTSTFDEADRFDDLFGRYDESTTSIVCVRTRSEMRLPPTLFVVVASPRQIPWDNWDGGESIDWRLQGDEVAPPAEAIITSDLGYDDFTAFYASYAAFTAAYASYTDATRDYTIAGTA